MMHTQTFIAEHGVDALTEQFAIVVKKYDNGYVKLNYSQIDSPKFHSIADECRGIVLHVQPDNSSTIIARSFQRFYNFGEGNTQNFDFSECVVAEKADGSLTLVCWSPVDNKWIVGTRGMVYAEGNFAFSLTAEGGSFYDWILKTMRLTEIDFQQCMDGFDQSCTYIMEYTSYANKIVTHYVEDSMVLLSVIDNESGFELAHPTALNMMTARLKDGGMNIRAPIFYQPASADELVALADALPGLQEGFVVCNLRTGERVKIKSKLYVAAHHLRGNGTPSRDRLMEVVLRNEQSELLTYFEEFRQYIEPIEASLATLLHDAEALYESYASVESQKEFALHVKDSPLAPLMFRIRKDRAAVRATFEDLDINVQKKLLEKFLPVVSPTEQLPLQSIDNT